MNPLLTLLVGPPGSGKTTWAKDYLKTHNNRNDLVYINQDIQGSELHLEKFKDALSKKYDIVVDRMNFSKKQRNRYINPARQKKYEIRIVVFHTPYEVCLDRVINRKNHPSIKDKETAIKAIDHFFYYYWRVEDQEADEVIRLGWAGKDTEQIIVCDIDGTIANTDHRLKYIKPNKTDWDLFFKDMDKDPVNYWCKELLTSISERHRVVFVTARPADYRDVTLKWLSQNGLMFAGSRLFTRMRMDYRKDSIVKEIILEFELKTRYDILFIVDDRTQVVNMWRSHGYNVLQCADGGF